MNKFVQIVKRLLNALQIWERNILKNASLELCETNSILIYVIYIFIFYASNFCMKAFHTKPAYILNVSAYKIGSAFKQIKNTHFLPSAKINLITFQKKIIKIELPNERRALISSKTLIISLTIRNEPYHVWDLIKNVTEWKYNSVCKECNAFVCLYYFFDTFFCVIIHFVQWFICTRRNHNTKIICINPSESITPIDTNVTFVND